MGVLWQHGTAHDASCASSHPVQVVSGIRKLTLGEILHVQRHQALQFKFKCIADGNTCEQLQQNRCHNLNGGCRALRRKACAHYGNVPVIWTPKCDLLTPASGGSLLHGCNPTRRRQSAGHVATDARNQLGWSVVGMDLTMVRRADVPVSCHTVRSPPGGEATRRRASRCVLMVAWVHCAHVALCDGKEACATRRPTGQV